MRACRGRAIAIILAGLLAGSCAPHHTAVPGRTSQQPQRIVSLSPGTTEILFALGLEDRIAGVTAQCDYPPLAKEKPQVGDVSISVERVVALEPDLVVGHSFLNRDALRSLEALDVPVLSIDPGSLADVEEAIRTLAGAAGVEDEGERLAAAMQAKIQNATDNVTSPDQKVRVLFAVQGDPIYASGSDTFVDEMIRLAGGANVSASTGAGSFNLFSEEAAVASNPDVIFVTDEDARQRFLRAPSWRQVRAVQEDRVELVDPDLYLRPAPRLADGFAQMVQILNSVRTAP